MTGELWEASIARTHALIERGERSVSEVVDSIIERLDRTEPDVRAWAHADRRSARETARAIDRAVRSGEPVPALAGAVVGVKDVIDVAGMPTVAGSASRAGSPPASRDAAVVAALRAGGAVVLGKTETYEFAFGQGEPPTRNPRDPGRYAGGSSIGSGVAVAVGSAHAALGTDTGGSVRNPAAVNGLVGLKPSAGLLDLAGLWTLSDTLDQIGPLARTVDDCELILHGMLAPGTPASRSAATDDLPGVRIAVDRAVWDTWGVTPQVEQQIEAALAILADLGARIVDVSIPELAMALPASLAIALSEAYSHHARALRTHPEGYLSGTRVMLETGALTSSADVALARRVRRFVTDRLTAVLDAAGAAALAAPTLPSIAPLLTAMDSALTGEAAEGSLASALRMLTTANLSGMPGLSFAAGMVDGQPVGMHLTGRRLAEPELFSIARAYERVAGWSTLVPLGAA